MNKEYTYSKQCPGAKDYELFLLGHMSDETVLQFEQHLSDCPLCREAVDGYRSFEHSKIPVRTLENRTHHFGMWKWTGIAAAVALTLTIGTHWYANKHKNRILDGFYLSEIYTNGDYISPYDNSGTKTFQARQNADYYYLGADNKLRINDRVVDINQVESAIESNDGVETVFIEVALEIKSEAEELVNKLRKNPDRKVFTYRSAR